MPELKKPSRIARTKEYLKNNAPSLVTALAAVGVLLTVRSAHKDARNVMQCVDNDRKNFGELLIHNKTQGVEFEWYPGIGMWSEDPTVPIENNTTP